MLSFLLIEGYAVTIYTLALISCHTMPRHACAMPPWRYAAAAYMPLVCCAAVPREICHLTPPSPATPLTFAPDTPADYLMLFSLIYFRYD